MGIGVSLILIAVGAILTWAVNATVSGLDINTIGVILMVVGAIGLVLSLMFWSTLGWRRWRPPAHHVRRRRASARLLSQAAHERIGEGGREAALVCARSRRERQLEAERRALAEAG